MPHTAKELPPQEILDFINETANAALELDSVHDLAKLITTSVKEKFGFYIVNMLLLDSPIDDNILHGRVYSTESGTINNEEVQFPLEASPSLAWIIQNKQARTFENLYSEMAFEQEHLAGAKAGAGFPLQIKSEIIAILFVFSNREEAIPAPLITALQLSTSIFSTIFNNIEKAKKFQEGKQTTSSLKQLSQDILLAKNEEEVLKYLMAGLASSNFLTGIYNVERDHLSVLGINDPTAPRARSSFEGIALPLHNIAEKLPQDDVLFIQDLSQNLELRNLASFYSRNEYQSAALYTVYELGQLSKIIVVSTQAPQTLSKEDLTVFDELIKSTRRSLSQFKEIKHLNQQLEELSTLQQVSEAVSAETSLDNLYATLHQQIQDVIGSDISFLVATISPVDEMIHIPYLFEEGQLKAVDPFPIGEGITSILIKQRKPIMVNENARQKFDEMGAKYLGEPSKSWLGVPLLIDNEAVGALIVQDMRRERRFSEIDLNILKTIAPHVALALRNAQTLTRMQDTMAALDKESYLLNSLLSNIPEQVYFLDKQGSFMLASHSYAQQIGVNDPSSLIGKSIKDYSSKEWAMLNTSLDTQTLETGEEVIDLVVQGKDPQGHSNWTMNSRIPLMGQENQMTGLLCLTQNINELKETEQLAQERAQRLEIASEIASEASQTLSADEILNKAVNLVRDRFGYYHASVFEIDPLGEYAVLREAAGEIGAEMLKIGHKLAIGSKSLVGQATGQGVPVVIEDVTKDPNYYPNPLLPETRAEMVVPVKLGDRIIGALDVQSTQVNAFPPEVVDVMQILSDQLAIATSNAQLFARTQTNLNKSRAINQIATSAASSTTMEDALDLIATQLQPIMNNANIAIFLTNQKKELEFRVATGFEDTNLSGKILAQHDSLLGQAVMELGPVLLRARGEEETLSRNTQSAMLIPFHFSENLLGAMCIESNQVAAFDQNELELMVNFGNMIAAIIYNNRLIAQVRRQAERQQALFDITNKVRQAVEMQSILQTSVSEICKAVGAQRARIEISPLQETPASTEAMINTSKEIQ